MKNELKMTVDELDYMQSKSENKEVLLDTMYENKRYRARLVPTFNSIRLYGDNGKEGNKVHIIAIWGYLLDDANWRIRRHGYGLWNDNEPINYEDVDDWLRRINGDVLMQWVLPSDKDIKSTVIDWRHPDVVID